MNTSVEKPDHHIYYGITLFPDSMRFFLAATNYYLSRLESELTKIESDELFSELFNESEIESLDLSSELKRFKRISNMIQKKINNGTEAWGFELTLAHGDLRILKSLGTLYISDLENRRDKLAIESSFSTLSIQSLDSKISRAKEVISIGIFKDATPWPLLIDESENVSPIEEVSDVDTQILSKRPPPRVLSTIEIVDQQLRERCLDLVEKFDKEDQPHRFDTVISDATRVLEDRIRTLSGADSTLKGAKLVDFAFGGKDPKLIVSEDPYEQKSAAHMYRGFFGFIRNRFHHELIEDLFRERVLQILGWTDHLIFLAQTATRNIDESTQ